MRHTNISTRPQNPQNPRLRKLASIRNQANGQPTAPSLSPSDQEIIRQALEKQRLMVSNLPRNVSAGVIRTIRAYRQQLDNLITKFGSQAN